MRTLLLLILASLLGLFIAHQFNLSRPAPDGLFPDLPVVKEPKAIPNDWLAKQKLYPHGGFNHEHYLYSLRQAELLHRTSASWRAAWEPAGPLNIGGRITDIAIHPSSPFTMYIGAASGGILKTSTNGFSWENVFTQAPVISIGALAIDPNNPDVLYAGTGESNAASQSFIGNGIYKTTDAGASWQHIGLEQSAYFGRILVDYNNSQRVFAAACGTLFTPNEQRGIYRTTNGGDTWERVLFVSDSTAGIDIVQHPTNPDILYAAMWERMRGLTYRRSHGPTSGIYKTTNGGDTWELINTGLPASPQMGRIGLAIARNNPEILYAFIDRNQNGNLTARVYKSMNGGTSWQTTSDGAIQGINSSFGWYFGQIRVDPQNDNRIWVLGVELYRSDNGGNSWTELAGYGNIDEIYVDQHALWIDPNTGRLVHGNDGGLYTSNDYGNNWTKINNLPLTQFYAIEVDYLNPQRIYGGTQDNNTVRTLTGALNDWQRILGGDGFYCLVDYTNSSIIYAESQWGALSRSMNTGNSFTSISNAWSSDRTNWSSPVIMHPTDPQTLYFGSYRVWKTTNRGTNWTAISGDLTHALISSGFSTITTLDISSLNPERIIAGSDDGRVNITLNGGGFWTDISYGLPLRWITRVAFDPFEPNTIYATVSGFRWDEPHPYVFRSTNLGNIWEGISGNLPELPVNVIVADPAVPNRLFVGTDAGVFYTEDGGLVWNGLSENIPNVPVTSMKIHQPTRTLVIGTYGCSAYKLNLDLLSGTHQPPVSEKQNGVILRPVYPNPFRGSDGLLQIECYAAVATEATIRVLDVSGKVVYSVFSGHLKGGSARFTWNGRTASGLTMPTGVYFIQLQTGIGSQQQKMLIVD